MHSICPYMILNTWIVISIASGFIDERDREFELKLLINQIFSKAMRSRRLILRSATMDTVRL